MKKKLNKVLLTSFTMVILVILISSINVTAVEAPDQTVNVQGDTIQTQIQSNNRTMFCFQERTRLTVCANIGLEVDINCEALKIGDKDVIIEVEGDGVLKMTMICTREENQLGLMNGSLVRVRNRNSYRYLEGVCISMEITSNCKCKCECDPDCTCTCECECKCDPVCDCECDCKCKCELECKCQCDTQCNCDPTCDCECDCQCKCDQECKCNSECPNDGTFLKARLRIRETNQNRNGQWAHYDEANEEWVTVTTINEDGYLTAEINTLSTWTLLVPEEMTSVIVNTTVIASVAAIGIIAISMFYFKKRH